VYLQDLANLFGTGSTAYQGAFADPSADNFRYYRDSYYDQNNTGILGRYKQFNNPQVIPQLQAQIPNSLQQQLYPMPKTEPRQHIK
jgi:hypothetical protein